jgi:sigma-B regulation protein RsbU (phosphoserine phosphatase)
VLSGLNLALCGKFQSNFVTAAYVFVDFKKNAMTYGGAGHPPLLLWEKSTGKAREVLENGLVLGQFEEATYDSLEVPIAPGNRFVLCTDGILESSNLLSQEEFGTKHLMQFMEKNHALGANAFADALLDELARWIGQSTDEGQKDDITALVIDFKD